MLHSNSRATGPAVLLVDADNLSSPESVEQALLMLIDRVGPVAIRRAYGSPENLKGLAGVMRDLAIRPCVNLPLSKNTTDMALAVDAMDLCQQFAPSVLAIGTGDADFAPLVLRLRERGVRTICFSQGNKMSPEVHGFYDEVVLIGPRSPRRGTMLPSAVRTSSVVLAQPATVTPAPEVALAAPSSAPAPAAKRAPRKRAAPKKDPAPMAAAPEPREPPAPARQARSGNAQPPSADALVRQQVRELLEQVPGLMDRKAVEFGDLVKQLRDAKLLSKSANASRFLKKHAPYIELTPEKQPNKAHWVSTGF